MTSIEPIKQRRVDSLDVHVHSDGKALGQAAAENVAAALTAAIEAHGRAAAIFATGASQFDFLAALRARDDVDWKRVIAFHLDEYVGMQPDHPASFRRYLREHIFEAVQPAEVHYLTGEAPDAEAECERYARLLAEKGPVDVACIGIGENGHIAFNDPHVADFDDPRAVKVVDLDEPCRRQQFGEGWFASLDEVPRLAFTLTIPTIMAARAISCVVPDKRKAEAARNAVEGPIETACPASVLRRHPSCILYLDAESASLLSS
jgi:glucosamine-6-phosphate deaminase